MSIDGTKVDTFESGVTVQVLSIALCIKQLERRFISSCNNYMYDTPYLLWAKKGNPNFYQPKCQVTSED